MLKCTMESAWESHVAHENAIPMFWSANISETEAGFNWRSWFLFRSWARTGKLGNNTWCWSLRPGVHVLWATGKYVKNAAWCCRNYLECSHADGSSGNNQLIEDLVDWPEPWPWWHAMEHSTPDWILATRQGPPWLCPVSVSCINVFDSDFWTSLNFGSERAARNCWMTTAVPLVEFEQKHCSAMTRLERPLDICKSSWTRLHPRLHWASQGTRIYWNKSW